MEKSAYKLEGAVKAVLANAECEYDWCDGSGWVEEGEFDESRIRKCMCKIDEETNAQVDLVLGK